MSKALQSLDVQAAPFFARFLEEQLAQASDVASDYSYNNGGAETLKYPSDWEDS